jgi:hypothetical protein
MILAQLFADLEVHGLFQDMTIVNIISVDISLFVDGFRPRTLMVSEQEDCLSSLQVSKMILVRLFADLELHGSFQDMTIVNIIC